MSNESENKRIDIAAYTQIFEADDGITDEQLVAFGLSALAELKRCYELLDAAEETYESIGLCLYCDACETEHESHCTFASE